MTAMSKDLAQLARQLRREGWAVEATKRGHIRWTSPTNKLVITGHHPNPFTMRRIRAQLAAAAQEETHAKDLRKRKS